MPELINVEELADYLKLKQQTIYNWLHQGKISGMKVGGVWRFDRKEIDNWLKSKNTKQGSRFSGRATCASADAGGKRTV